MITGTPPEPNNAVNARFLRTIDGDTLEAVLRYGARHVAENVRLRWVNTPERGEPGWAEARDALAELCGPPLAPLRLVLIGLSINRVVAEVYRHRPEGWIDVAHTLIDLGYGERIAGAGLPLRTIRF